MSDEFRYDPNTGSFRPANDRPPKKNDDWGGWVLIVIMFAGGLWPLGLVLLVSKLREGGRRSAAERQHRRDEQRRREEEQRRAEQEKRTAAQRAKQAARDAARAPAPTDKTARVLTIVGGVVTAIFGVGLLATLGEAIGYGWQAAMWEDVLSIGGFLAAGIVTLFAGQRMKKRTRRFARYLVVLGERDSVTVDELARVVGKRRRTVENDLEDMLDQGMFGALAYYDEGRGTLYRSAAARSAEEQRRMQQAQQQEKQPDAQPAAGDYDAYLAAIRRANDRIPDQVLSDKMDRMEDVARRIFREIEQHPEKKPQAAKFLDYYLPTTLKLLETYADFDEAGVEGENLRQAKGRIETIMDSLIAGFEHQLDELYRNEAMDIDSDIRVMESMLRRDMTTVADDFGLGDAAMQFGPDGE